MSNAVDRHAFLLHDLQQRCVRFSRRTINLIGQQQLREDGAGAEVKFLRLHIEDGSTGNVRRHQVRGELDASEFTAQNLPQRSHEKCFAKSWHAFDQDVAAGEDSDQRAFDQIFLTDKDFGNLVSDLLVKTAGLGVGARGNRLWLGSGCRKRFHRRRRGRLCLRLIAGRDVDDAATVRAFGLFAARRDGDLERTAAAGAGELKFFGDRVQRNIHFNFLVFN